LDAVRRGPELRCAQTASTLGWESVVVDDAVADLDNGSWRGKSLGDVARDDLLSWLTDPDAAPHGGESVRDVLDRVSAWLDGLGEVGRLGVVTSPAVVRAVVLTSLGAPASAFWRVDVAPLTVTHVYGSAGRWTMRETGLPLA
jgi:broad specificity phosphatase PhoE